MGLIELVRNWSYLVKLRFWNPLRSTIDIRWWSFRRRHQGNATNETAALSIIAATALSVTKGRQWWLLCKIQLATRSLTSAELRFQQWLWLKAIRAALSSPSSDFFPLEELWRGQRTVATNEEGRAWRECWRRLEFICHDAKRYDRYRFGNG